MVSGVCSCGWGRGQFAVEFSGGGVDDADVVVVNEHSGSWHPHWSIANCVEAFSGSSAIALIVASICRLTSSGVEAMGPIESSAA